MVVSVLETLAARAGARRETVLAAAARYAAILRDAGQPD